MFNRLYERLLSIDEEEDPISNLRKTGREYVRFGLENPDEYDLMFIEKAPMEMIEDEDTWNCAMRTFELLVSRIQACVDAGYFKQEHHMNHVFFAFASVHGMVTLHNRRSMKMFPEETHLPLIKQSLDMMVDMMISLKE